jgi:glycosyltransferase involved in cell wall biosynthesis
MKLALIICTYMRPQPLLHLLHSVQQQTRYPDAIWIVDGSTDTATETILQEQHFPNLVYHRVAPSERGLTQQRNIGVAFAKDTAEVLSFLDDDTVLDAWYFEAIEASYEANPEVLGVGGYITNEVTWEQSEEKEPMRRDEFYFDGWKRKDGSRFVLRKRLCLDADLPPGYMPTFGHGRSIGFLPPSGKEYSVEQLMGGVASYRTAVFDRFQFSLFFEGYGLYEDADFSLRVAKSGALLVNTRATLAHYHEPSGRPHHYCYGKMVVRNGWYVWRVKWPNPSIKAKFQWHANTLLLIGIRLSNIFTTSTWQAAFLESMGRILGWLGLFVKQPKTKA